MTLFVWHNYNGAIICLVEIGNVWEYDDKILDKKNGDIVKKKDEFIFARFYFKIIILLCDLFRHASKYFNYVSSR